VRKFFIVTATLLGTTAAAEPTSGFYGGIDVSTFDVDFENLTLAMAPVWACTQAIVTLSPRRPSSKENSLRRT
jgi:hypothetical protein